MRAICQRSKYYQALNLFARAIIARKTFALLGNVCIETMDTSCLRWTSTDLDLGIEWYTPAVIEEEGRVVVPVRPLLEWMQDQPGAEYVSLAEEKLPRTETPVLFMNGQVAFFCQDSSLFPPVRRPMPMTTIRISAPLLKRVMLQVVFAASREAHPTFSHVWLHCDGPALTFSASDGSRCALNTVIASKSIGHHLFLTPASTIKRIARFLPRKGFVCLEVDQRKSLLCIRTGNGTFLARLCYPELDPRHGVDPVTYHTQGGKSRPFEGYLPHHPQTRVTIEKQALQGILKKKSWPVHCSLQWSDGQPHMRLVIYRTNDVITRTIPISIEGPAFSPCWITMRSLADALAAPGTPSRFRLEFGSPGTNAVALWWIERDGSVRTGYAYAFAPADSIGVMHHPQVRRSLSAQALQYLGQWPSPPKIGLWEQRIVPYLRRETATLVVSMLEHGIRPTDEQIEQSKKRIKSVSMHLRLYGLASVCRERDHLARELAIGAFSSDGSSLEVAGASLSFVAAEIAQAFAAFQGSSEPLLSLH
jgi:hypothetical protein